MTSSDELEKVFERFDRRGPQSWTDKLPSNSMAKRVLGKLFTNEDHLQIHKTFGILSLVSFIYRYCWVYPRTGTLGFDGSIMDHLTIFVHIMLSTSSLIFHVLKARIFNRPMIIWEEYRLHAIVFSTRCMNVYIFGCLRPYLGIQDTNIERIILVCLVLIHHVVADLITAKYGAKDGSTTVRVKDAYNSSITYILRFYAFYQFAALGSHLVPNARLCDLGYNTFIAIQSSAFLMTLYRKSVITEMAHAGWYTTCLLFSMSYIFKSCSVSSMFFLKLGGVFIARTQFKINKYILWLTFSSISLPHIEDQIVAIIQPILDASIIVLKTIITDLKAIVLIQISLLGLTKELAWEFAFYGCVAWICCEILFFCVMYFAVGSSLKELKTPPPYKDSPVELLNRILNTLDEFKTYETTDFFTGFFCGAKLETIKKDNYRSFLAWMMYANFYEKLSSDENKTLNEAMHATFKRLNLTPEDGFNPDIKHVNMTLDKNIPYIHRPLFLYMVSGIKNVLTNITLQGLGFHQHKMQNLTYWYRPSGTSEDYSAPIMFFHGITPGWAPYINCVMKLSHKRAVFLMDLEAIKINSLNFEMPTPEHYSSTVKKIIDKHNIRKVSLVGHSFGSITAGWFLKSFPDSVSHLTLIDPVSLMLALPDVAYNYLYRPPSSIMQWILMRTSKDVTISNCLRRNFWWYKNVLWLEDIPLDIGVHVSLAGSDEVTKSDTIQEYVQNCGKRRSSHPLGSNVKPAHITSSYRINHSHGQILFSEKCINELAGSLNQGEKQSAFSGKL